MGKIVGRLEMIEIIGCSDTTLKNWQKDGLPVNSEGTRGRPNSYDTEQVIKWMVHTKGGNNKDALDLSAERARLASHQADKAELDVKTRRGELLLAEDVAKTWEEQVTACKSRLLGIASKAAPMTIAAKNAGEAQEIIDSLVREALMELADEYAIQKSEASDAEGNMEPTTEDDGERLGG